MVNRTKDFIYRATIIHGNRYLYDNTCYVNSRSTLQITCKVHGSFSQLPFVHLSGKGCTDCGRASSTRKRSSNAAIFSSKASLAHSGKYDYSKVMYKTATLAVIIVCPTHGDFYQKPNDHLSGYGCPRCGIDSNKLDLEEFIKRSTECHGLKYDYSSSVYSRAKDPISILCKESGHGEFTLRRASNHYREKIGCPKCDMKRKREKSKPEKELFKIIKKRYPDAVRGVRDIISPQELDIVIPSAKIAIEFNGVYWHSTKFLSDPLYHYNKTISSSGAGYTLFHVFSDDWVNSKEALIIDLLDIIGKCRDAVVESTLSRNDIIALLSSSRSTIDYKEEEGMFKVTTHRHWPILDSRLVQAGFRIVSETEPTRWQVGDIKGFKYKTLDEEASVIGYDIYDCGLMYWERQVG